jgi:uncharacterized membrane protein YphA (DoxX/SURF4 family)
MPRFAARSVLDLARIGRACFGLAVAALGVDSLVLGGFLPELQPAPAGLPAPGVLAAITAAILVAAGACLAADLRGRLAARALTGVTLAWLVAFHVPLLVAHPGDGGAWTTAFESLAIASAAAVRGWPTRPAAGRLGFALALVAFGVLHFRYRAYVASVIPAWLPGHLFWAYATGVAHLAAGAAIALGVAGRLAAVLAGAMFGSWVVILHAPRVIADASRPECSSLIIALAMCGAAWLLTEYFSGFPTASGQSQKRQ